MVCARTDCAETRHKARDHRRDRGRPPAVRDERRARNLYDFLELHRNKRVSDATYDRALKRFGEIGVLDITGVNGYYTNLAMIMNTTRFPIPGDGKRLPRF